MNGQLCVCEVIGELYKKCSGAGMQEYKRPTKADETDGRIVV